MAVCSACSVGLMFLGAGKLRSLKPRGPGNDINKMLNILFLKLPAVLVGFDLVVPRRSRNLSRQS